MLLINCDFVIFFLDFFLSTMWGGGESDLLSHFFEWGGVWRKKSSDERGPSALFGRVCFSSRFQAAEFRADGSCTGIPIETCFCGPKARTRRAGDQIDYRWRSVSAYRCSPRRTSRFACVNVDARDIAVAKLYFTGWSTVTHRFAGALYLQEIENFFLASSVARSRIFTLFFFHFFFLPLFFLAQVGALCTMHVFPRQYVHLL